MHSPPVQPISSSTSGTGSVITMWLEVTVSRRRSGRLAGAAPAPVASTAAPARTRPPVGARRRRRRPSRRGAVDRRALEDGHPALAAARDRSPSGEPRRLHGRGAGIEGAGAEDRRGAAGPDLGLGQRAAGVRARRAPRRRRRPSRQAPSQARRGRDLQVAGLPVPGVDALLLAPAADPVDRVLRGAGDRERRRVAEASRSVGRLNQIALTKPPLRPLGPSPQRSASSSTTRASGSSCLTCHAVHMPV